jgi:DNA-binding response OmpR family regulator
LISRHDSSFADDVFTAESPYDVILLDADRTPVTNQRIWARIHLLLPEVHVIALTDGTDAKILQAVLAAGINGLFRPDCDPAILDLAIRKAAQGLIDFDPSLVKLARTILLEPLTETQIRFGGLTIDLRSREVTRWGQHIHLTPLEFRVLAYLAQQRGHTMCPTELLSAVWLAPPDRGGTLAQVHNCIKRIRQKIEPDFKHPRYLLSERGWGYWLQDPASPRDFSFSTPSSSTQAVPC